MTFYYGPRFKFLRMEGPIYLFTDRDMNVTQFDPARTDYSVQDLEDFTDAILRADKKENGRVHHILFEEHLKSRRRREPSLGTVDETLTNLLSKSDRPGVTAGDGQMIFNRRHPKGRKVNNKEQRKRHGASYYSH